MARGEREAAREAFDRATRLDSGNGFAWANRGAADMLLGDAESARRAYRRALEVDGDNWLAHYNLGVYYARSQAGGAALESLSKSVAALRRSGAGVEVAAVLNDLETNSVFSEMRHDPRFRELLTRLR
jgi:Flp pilus assembly protein TadD